MELSRSCAIIGAGPAGATAATLLADAGWDVTIFEKARFPRAKVCGEFISPAATDLLERLVCASDLEGLGARRCGGVAIEVGAGETRWRLPRPGWALSRAALDDALLGRAAAAGAVVCAPAIVREVRYGADGVIVVADDSTGKRRELQAAIVIHADGFGRHDPAGCVPIDTRLVAMKRHVRRATPEPGVVRLRAQRGAYSGMIDVEGGLSTCAWVTRRRGPGGLADAFRDAGAPCGPMLACPVPRSGYVAPGHVRSVRIGNAAAAVDPVGGEGIGLALWSGATVAELLATTEVDGASLARAQARFARLYRSRLRARLPACRLGAEMLMRPRVARLARPALDLGAIGPWSRLTGKPGRGGRRRAAPAS